MDPLAVRYESGIGIWKSYDKKRAASNGHVL